MKDASLALRTGYYNVITGITYNGSPLAAYDSLAPDSVQLDESFHYVILSSQTTTPNYNRQGFVTECTMLLDVVTGYVGTGGRKAADEISDKILQSVRPLTGEGVSATGFRLQNTQLVSIDDFVEVSDTHKIFRKLIRIRHQLCEL